MCVMIYDISCPTCYDKSYKNIKDKYTNMTVNILLFVYRQNR